MLEAIESLVHTKWDRVVEKRGVIHISISRGLYLGVLVKLGIVWPGSKVIPNRFPKYSKGLITLDKGT